MNGTLENQFLIIGDACKASRDSCVASEVKFKTWLMVGGRSSAAESEARLKNAGA
jgi:hypothetical protein